MRGPSQLAARWRVNLANTEPVDQTKGLIEILKEPAETTRARGMAELLFQAESYGLVLTRLLQCLAAKVTEPDARRDLVAALTFSHEFNSWLAVHYSALHDYAQKGAEPETASKPPPEDPEVAATLH